MNDRKFTFIFCTNDSLLLEESIHYINHLIVPDGYETDLLTVTDAASITEGYNEAMQASDAKYKIYIHQDVFILNKYFLCDLLSIFESDPLIGMIGMVGYEKVAKDGIIWHSNRAGNIYVSRPKSPYPDLSGYRYNAAHEGYDLVAEIDGFLMATCQDLPWDTDRLDGWDFYDAFQSIHFLSEGYKIAVPRQSHPWCMHDSDKMLTLFRYDHYRQIFIQTYPQLLGRSCTEIYDILRRPD